MLRVGEVEHQPARLGSGRGRTVVRRRHALNNRFEQFLDASTRLPRYGYDIFPLAVDELREFVRDLVHTRRGRINFGDHRDDDAPLLLGHCERGERLCLYALC